MGETFTLRPYQKDAVEKLWRGWEQTHGTKLHRTQLVVLATGLGKTVLFADVIRAHLERGERALVLAHREELLDQAEDKIRSTVGSTYWIDREMAKSQASLMSRIVTASVQTLGRTSGDPQDREYKGEGAMGPPSSANWRLSRFPRDHFGLVVVDEAHHATAATYRQILDYFDTARVLGLTATPRRADGESLHGVFDRVAYRLDIVDGTRQGFLAPVVSHRVKSATDLGGVRTTAGDYNLKDLAKRVNNTARNSLIVETYCNRFNGRQAIVFATDVEHARAIDSELQSMGVSCAAITGDMDKDLRRREIGRFKSGDLRVLTNFGVLTEGFDHAALDVIINARPTKSPLLLTQILGRGTRIHPGKGKLDFVEIIDGHSDETATAAEVFGFPQRFDCQLHDFVECLAAAERMVKEREGFGAFKCLGWDDMHTRFAKALAAPVQASAALEDSICSRFRWYPTAGGSLRLRFRDVDNQASMEFLVTLDPMGGWRWGVYENPEAERKMVKAFICESREAAMKACEEWVEQLRPNWDRLLNLGAAWRQRAQVQPCSDKQWTLIERFRLAPGRSRGQVSKGMAMQLLDAFFNAKSRRQ